MRMEPMAYATQLAEAMTGTPVVTEGYSPEYDLLMKVAPPAALTPEGIQVAHQMVIPGSQWFEP